MLSNGQPTSTVLTCFNSEGVLHLSFPQNFDIVSVTEYRMGRFGGCNELGGEWLDIDAGEWVQPI